MAVVVVVMVMMVPVAHAGGLRPSPHGETACDVSKQLFAGMLEDSTV